MDTILQPQTPSPALAVLAVLLAALAIGLLLRIGWIRAREYRSGRDGPELLLDIAVGGLPEERRDWGAAMMAELAQIPDPAVRWRFALGCASVAIAPPVKSGLPVALTAAASAAAAVATSLAMERAVPGLRVFAVTLVALVGALATVTAARPRRPSLAAPGVAVLLGVAGCIATTLYVVTKYPIAARDPSHIVSVAFALLLAGYLWLALTPPRALATHRCAGRLGVVTALAMHLVIGLGAPAIYASSTSDLAWFCGFIYGFGVVTILVVTCSALAARIGRSGRAGVVAALWAGMVSALLVFPVFLLSQLHGEFNFGAYLRSNWRHGGMPELDAYLTRYVGEELASCIVALVLFPAMAVLLGLIGAAIGCATRRIPAPASRSESPRRDPSSRRISPCRPSDTPLQPRGRSIASGGRAVSPARR